jgi:lambda repressor-like predicted transcriptional regulator
MPVGHSGRIVIEMDPAQKQELYAALQQDGWSLKQWFLARVDEYLRDRLQLSLHLTCPRGDQDDGGFG